MSNFFFESVVSNNISDSQNKSMQDTLNDTNDLTRLAYQNKSGDIPIRNNSMTDRFESDTFINHKESFEANNSRLNGLYDEIRELISITLSLNKKKNCWLSIDILNFLIFFNIKKKNQVAEILNKIFFELIDQGKNFENLLISGFTNNFLKTNSFNIFITINQREVGRRWI